MRDSDGVATTMGRCLLSVDSEARDGGRKRVAHNLLKDVGYSGSGVREERRGEEANFKTLTEKWLGELPLYSAKMVRGRNLMQRKRLLSHAPWGSLLN